MVKFGAAPEAISSYLPSREKQLQKNGEPSSEGSPVLWSRSPTKISPECPYGGPAKSDSQGVPEDLYNIYGKMSSNCDLTFRDLCAHVSSTTMLRDQQSPDAVQSDVDSIDLSKGLAAIQSTKTTQQISSKSKTETEIPVESMMTRCLSLKDHFYLENNKSKKDSFADKTRLPRNRSLGSQTRQHPGIGTPVGSAKEAGDGRNSLDESKLDNTITTAKQPGGTAHSNFCCICNKMLYFFKTRCLVCGKCYCSQCVKQGMGSMPEGRKCKSCRGSRFSRRYIERAGKTWLRLPNAVRLAEIKWAKKGYRKPKP